MTTVSAVNIMTQERHNIPELVMESENLHQRMANQGIESRETMLTKEKNTEILREQYPYLVRSYAE